MTRKVLFAAVAAAVLFTACDSFGQAMTAHTDVVARAAGAELTVEETTDLLMENQQLPAQTEVVEALANLWVDYILLGMAVVEDTSLQSVDIDPLIQAEIDQALVWKLRDEVVQPDTIFTEEELRQLYEEEQPGAQITARHILLQVPPDATPEQRDSVREQIEAIRDSALAGEDFAELATAHSQDPGSAESGGSLGTFGRDRMVPAFEEAAFALEEGEISDVVETPFGYHIILVEEREVPEFEAASADFESTMRRQRIIDAEEAYISGLVDPLDLEVEDDAVEIARELASSPQTTLNSRAARRPLVSYEGGAYTAADFQRTVRRFSPQQQAQFANIGAEQLEEALEQLAQNQILVEEAERRGLEIGPEERDSLATEARRQLRAAVNAAGLDEVEPEEGETTREAVERNVNELLLAIMRNERNVIPLGVVGTLLRDVYDDVRINERSFTEVVENLEERRPEAGQTPPGGAATPRQVPVQPPPGTTGQQPTPQSGDTSPPTP